MNLRNLDVIYHNMSLLQIMSAPLCPQITTMYPFMMLLLPADDETTHPLSKQDLGKSNITHWNHDTASTTAKYNLLKIDMIKLAILPKK